MSFAAFGIRWLLYPLLWIWATGWIAYGLSNPESLQLAVAAKGGVMVVLLIALEWLYPYDERWKMTWQHLFKRDVIFVAINGATLALLGYVLVLLAIDVAEDSLGLMTGMPLWIQVVVGLIVFEALQYTVHRYMHLEGSAIRNFLWRAHAIHHLPQQLYVVMHAVFHPFNAIPIRYCTQILPIWLLGYDPEAVFVFGSVIALHGTISHLNLDLRMGWLNYLFVGPELHRYHHSANSHEARNYGATLSVFDWLLGTFLYRPGTPPKQLGLSEADGYPGQHDPVTAVLFPFSTQPVDSAVTAVGPERIGS